MEPTTAALIAKAAANVLTDKRAWTGIASVIVAVCLPVGKLYADGKLLAKDLSSHSYYYSNNP